MTGRKNKKLLTESGAIIKKGYKGKFYKEWMEKTKHEDRERVETEVANKSKLFIYRVYVLP